MQVVRLAGQITPESYQLHLDIALDAFRFIGHEQITFHLQQATTQLTFHAAGLGITAATLGATASTAIRYDKAAQTVSFTFGRAIPAGRHTLQLSFTGPISDSLHGFYRSQYQHRGRTQWLAVTQFESIHAREAFVCIDEPAAKAVFNLSLTIPAELTALANTPVLSTTPAGAGSKTVRFARTPRCSTYLVAYVVGHLEYTEATSAEGVTIRVYATPGKHGQAAFALDVASRTLSFFTSYFGAAYPLPKLDMIAIPDFAAGAMENWGLITYRESSLLLDPAKASLPNQQRVAEVIAHELAHQWFGNLVTMTWWNDLWLNEGFATWCADLARDHLFPDWHIWTRFVEQTTDYALGLDSLSSTHPIEVQVDDPRELDQIFDAVSYEKGAGIIRMLQQYLGADPFQRGLQAYIQQHQYGSATTSDLWHALSQSSGQPVEVVMTAWTQQAGFPLLAFHDGHLTQHRFYGSPRAAARDAASPIAVWPVPFTGLAADGQTTLPVLINEPDQPLPSILSAAAWFKPNPGQTGFYRSLYSPEQLQALTPPLADAQLGAADRFGVVSDVFATTQAGATPTAATLQLAAALRYETDYLVWTALSHGFTALHAAAIASDLRPSLEQFGRWLFAPNLQRLGWQPQPDESAFSTLLRPLVLQQAIRFGDPEALQQARAQFAAYRRGRRLNPDLRNAVLYGVARTGAETEFELLLNLYRHEPSPQVKMSLLSALCSFRQPQLVHRSLHLGISADVRPQDTIFVLAWGLHNPDAAAQTWQFVQQHWPLFVKRYGAGGHMLERIPTYLGVGFATHAMARQVQAFFAAYPHPVLPRAVAGAVETIELKADWISRDYASIDTFLANWRTTNA